MPSPGANEQPSLQRDGVVVALFIEMTVMLVAGLADAYVVFGYALVAFVGTLVSMGFVRRDDRLTWGIPILAAVLLLVGMIGVFLTEDVVVQGEGDTVLGFHPATAFLVYVIWIPAFFTVGLTFTLLYDRISGAVEGKKLGPPPEEAPPEPPAETKPAAPARKAPARKKPASRKKSGRKGVSA